MKQAFSILAVMTVLSITFCGAVNAVEPVDVAPIEEPPKSVNDPVTSEPEPRAPQPRPEDSQLPPLDKASLVEEPLVRPAIVATDCALIGKSTFAINQGDKELLELAFKQCNLEISDDGVIDATISVQATLNSNADVSHCSTFQLAMLFEGLSAGDRIRWHGQRSLVDNLIVENIEGDKRDLGYFVLHDKPVEPPTTMGQVLFTPAPSPGYPHIYWGSASFLREDNTGPLAAEIRKNTPIVHRDSAGRAGQEAVDLKVTLSIEAYEPRGWCLFKDKTTGEMTSVLLSAVAK